MKFLALLAFFGVALGAAELEQPPARPGLQINADFAVLDLKTNIVFYSNNVVVVDAPAKPGDPPTTLKCHELRAKRGTNGFEWIQADGNVEIDQGDMHARGDRAFYSGATDQIEITGGTPLLFSSQITNRGDVIVYDRRNERLYIRKPTTDLPSGSLNKASPFGTNSSTTNKSPPGAKPQKNPLFTR
jgi:lipopolysaccharide transport protein LptA